MTIVAGERAEQTRARYPDSEGYVERDGVRVFYEVYGDGEPTVLLLPTWSIVHSRHWKMQIPYLARHFRVLTFDGRGHGKTDRPAEPEAYHEREFAADAIAVMNATDTDQAVIVGFSMGGQRGLLLAAEHPERVAGAAFIGPSFPGGRRAVARAVGIRLRQGVRNRRRWAKFNKHYWLRDYPAFVDFFMSRIFTEPHSTKPIEDMVGWALETDAQTLIATVEAPALTPEDARALCRPSSLSLLVVHGEDDAVVSVTRGIALAEQTGGQLVILKGSGHAPPCTRPREDQPVPA